MSSGGVTPAPGGGSQPGIPLEDPGNVWAPNTAVTEGYQIAATVDAELRVFEATSTGTTHPTAAAFTDFTVNLTPLGITEAGPVDWRYLGIVGDISWEYLSALAASPFDPATGALTITYTDDNDVALNVDYTGDPTDYIPLLWVGGDDNGASGKQVLSLDSTGDSDWYFRDGGTSLKFHRKHDGENKLIATIGDGGFNANVDGGNLLAIDFDQKSLSVLNNVGDNVLFQILKATDALGFYGAAPTAKQTGVAVNAAAIHAALVTLGLIGA